MGYIITVNKRVDVELRRDGFILHVEGRDPRDVPQEYPYEDANAIKKALDRVTGSSRYQAWKATK